MSLYAQFYKEVAGWETIETPEFFATYQISEVSGVKGLKIVNVFLVNELRSKGMSYDILYMLEVEAKKQGCTLLSAVVAKDSSEFTQQRTTHILRTNGMDLMYEDDYNKIYGRRI